MLWSNSHLWSIWGPRLAPRRYIKHHRTNSQRNNPKTNSSAHVAHTSLQQFECYHASEQSKLFINRQPQTTTVRLLVLLRCIPQSSTSIRLESMDRASTSALAFKSSSNTLDIGHFSWGSCLEKVLQDLVSGVNICYQHIIHCLFEPYPIFVYCIFMYISYFDMLNTFYHIHLGPVFVIHALHPWFSHLLRFVDHGLVQGSLSMEIRSIHLCTWRYSLDFPGCVLIPGF